MFVHNFARTFRECSLLAGKYFATTGICLYRRQLNIIDRCSLWLYCYNECWSLPRVARTCLSSAPITVPFPSLSNTLRPSTKSSKVPRSLALQMCWCMGRNWSKSSIFTCISDNKTTRYVSVAWPGFRVDSQAHVHRQWKSVRGQGLTFSFGFA